MDEHKSEELIQVHTRPQQNDAEKKKDYQTMTKKESLIMDNASDKVDDIAKKASIQMEEIAKDVRELTEGDKEVSIIPKELTDKDSILMQEDDDISQNTVDDVSQEDSPKKGGFGKLLTTVVVLAAVGGGAYYYATEQGLLGDSVKSSTSQTSEDPLVQDDASQATSEAPTTAVTTMENAESDTVATDELNKSKDVVMQNEGVETMTAQSTDVDISTPPEMPSEETMEENASTNSTQGVDSEDQSAQEALVEKDVSQENTVLGSYEIKTLDKEEVSDKESQTQEVDHIFVEPNDAAQINADETASSQSTDSAIQPENSVDVQNIELLNNRLQEKDKEITALKEQLQKAQDTIASNTQAKQKTQQDTFTEISRIYQIADFEREVGTNKTRVIQALSLMSSIIPQDSVWGEIYQAVRNDLNAVEVAEVVDTQALFKATQELEQLLQKAPFISPESSDAVVVAHDSSSAGKTADATDTSSVEEGAWLDRAINQVEKLPAVAYEAIRSDLGGFITVEKLSNPSAATLSIEGIKLQRQEALAQLRIAQEALLKRQDTVWKSSMQKLEQQLATYYNSNVDTTQQALALVRKLTSTSVESRLPNLSHTQKALEQMKHTLGTNN